MDIDCGMNRLELKAKAGTDWIYIVSEGVYNGTFSRAEGQTVQDSDESEMPTIRGDNNIGVVNTEHDEEASYLSSHRTQGHHQAQRRYGLRNCVR